MDGGEGAGRWRAEFFLRDNPKATRTPGWAVRIPTFPLSSNDRVPVPNIPKGVEDLHPGAPQYEDQCDAKSSGRDHASSRTRGTPL